MITNHLDAARERLAAMEARIVRIDGEIGGGDSSERDRLTREYDALHAALSFVEDVLPGLPTCVCGKVCHPSRESAQEHIAALTVLDPPRLTRLLPTKMSSVANDMNAYWCPRASADMVYHVGHRIIRK